MNDRVITFQLPCGRIAIADEIDAAVLVGHSWRVQPNGTGTGYVVYTKNAGRSAVLVRMHRLVMGAADGQLIDHRDGDGLNNRRYNLRIANRHQNMRNRIKHIPGRSVFKGVTAAGRNWRARIGTGSARVSIGFFKTEQEAALAYDEAARREFGDFARLNFPFPHEMPAMAEGDIS